MNSEYCLISDCRLTKRGEKSWTGCVTERASGGSPGECCLIRGCAWEGEERAGVQRGGAGEGVHQEGWGYCLTSGCAG